MSESVASSHSLFNLPTELRIKIYEQLFASYDETGKQLLRVNALGGIARCPSSSQLLRTNRKIYTEALETFYKSLAITAAKIEGLSHVLRTVGNHACAHIREVHLETKGYPFESHDKISGPFPPLPSLRKFHISSESPLVSGENTTCAEREAKLMLEHNPHYGWNRWTSRLMRWTCSRTNIVWTIAVKSVRKIPRKVSYAAIARPTHICACVYEVQEEVEVCLRVEMVKLTNEETNEVMEKLTFSDMFAGIDGGAEGHVNVVHRDLEVSDTVLA